MRQQEVRHALISVNLIFHARKSMPFVFVNFVIHRSPPLFDRIDDLLGFGFRTARIVPSR